MKRSKYRASALKAGLRSGLEEDNQNHLKDLGVGFEYEKFKIKYVTREKTYTPDFKLDNGVIVECKGYFKAADRAKHLLVKAQHPTLDIRFVFSNANNKLNKKSKTTYGQWCDRHGFMWAQGLIPKEWVK